LLSPRSRFFFCALSWFFGRESRSFLGTWMLLPDFPVSCQRIFLSAPTRRNFGSKLSGLSFSCCSPCCGATIPSGPVFLMPVFSLPFGDPGLRFPPWTDRPPRPLCFFLGIFVLVRCYSTPRLVGRFLFFRLHLKDGGTGPLHLYSALPARLSYFVSLMSRIAVSAVFNSSFRLIIITAPYPYRAAKTALHFDGSGDLLLCQVVPPPPTLIVMFFLF